MYVSWIMAFVVIVAVTYLLRWWKGVLFKSWAFLGIFFVFLVYVASYSYPRHDYFYHIIDLLLLGLGTFLIALNVERKPEENGRRRERDDPPGG